MEDLSWLPVRNKEEKKDKEDLSWLPVRGKNIKQPQEKSFTEFATQKVPQNIGRYISAAVSPFQTATAIGEKVGRLGRAGLEYITGEEVDPEARQAAQEAWGPIQKSIEEPSGIPGRIVDYAYENPVDVALMAVPGLAAGGKAATAVGMPTLGKAMTATAGLPGKAISKGVEKTTKLFEPPPFDKVVYKGITKGIRPSVVGQGSFPQIQKYMGEASDAVKTIIENKNLVELTDQSGNVVKGKLPSSTLQMSEAIDANKKVIFQQFNDLAKISKDKGASIGLSPIYNELLSIADDPVINTMAPEAARYARNFASRLKKQGIYDPLQAQDSIAIINKRLNAFYKKPSYEKATSAYVDSVVVNKLREFLDQAVDSMTGEAYQPLKNKYGALKSIEKDVANRAVVDSRKNIKGLIDFSDIFSGAEAIKGIVNLDPGAFASGMAAKTIARYYKKLNDPNHIIADMFTKGEKALANIPPVEPYSGPTSGKIGWNPRMGPVPGNPPIPNPPIPFEPKVAGLPVDTGQYFGTGAVRQPRLEWWRGPGAKGVEAIPEGPLALPGGQGFTNPGGLYGERAVPMDVKFDVIPRQGIPGPPPKGTPKGYVIEIDKDGKVIYRRTKAGDFIK